MASDEIALVLSHPPHHHHPQHLLHHHHDFHNHRPPAGTTTNKTTRELTGFIEHQNRHYQPQSATEFRRSICEPLYHRGIHDWDIRNGRDSTSPSGDGSDSDDEDDDDDDMNDGDQNDHVVGFVNSSDDLKIAHKSNDSGSCSSGEINGNGKRNHLSSIVSIRDVMKEETVMLSGNDIINVRSSPIENYQHAQLCQFQNAITIADPGGGELYYPQYQNTGVDGSGPGFKDMLVENGCGFSGRKDVSGSGGSGESLRTILSDPLTGALMDDAMILPCGHSFGSSGMQHVLKMKACYTCSNPVSEGSVAPNLSLRSAVFAFCREEELQGQRASKRRNRSDQDKSNYGDLALMEQSRGRGVQFPFFVNDRVIIKGNKRTPPRFVGREAVVTTQCLNGWYVVKTLDNAESVKLQYRSLAKVEDSEPSTQASSRITPPKWL